MKQWIAIFCAGLILHACSGNFSKETENNQPAQIPVVKTDYPYTIEEPDNWDKGNKENTLIVLKSMKAYEEGRIDKSLSYFADSVHVQFDHLDTTFSRETFKNIMSKNWENLKSMNFKIDDWESVVSKNKKQEFVTVWYKEFLEFKDGKKDSTGIVNDFRIKDGKIAYMSEFTRKL